jgi:hypothetical protein
MMIGLECAAPRAQTVHMNAAVSNTPTDPRAAEAALLARVVAAASGGAAPADAIEASVFRIVGHWLAPQRPDAGRSLRESGDAYFAAAGGHAVSADALVATGVLIGLSRFRDQVFRAMGLRS